MRRLATAVLVLLVAAGACSRPPEAASWLQRFGEAQRLADAALKQGDVPTARELLAQAWQMPVPETLHPQDARALRQDTCYRLARLELDAGRPAAALDWTARGLAAGEAASLFVANLYLVRGQALEATGRDAEAARSYERALQINQRLLEAKLPEQGGKR